MLRRYTLPCDERGCSFVAVHESPEDWGAGRFRVAELRQAHKKAAHGSGKPLSLRVDEVEEKVVREDDTPLGVKVKPDKPGGQ